jgi:hypothetical protein
VVVDVGVLVVVVLLHDAKTIDITMRQVSAIQIVPFFIHTSFSLTLVILITVCSRDIRFLNRLFVHISSIVNNRYEHSYGRVA